ncbi:MAG: LytTR family DNA-binding domain-containing protein [Bacteroidota bacterium]
MTCIIVEDEPLALRILESYIQKVLTLDLQACFRDALKAWEYLQQNEVDLLFLDINMPDLNGIQLLNALPQPPMVIFTTAYAQYAVESYQLNAVDYLLKPIAFDRFLQAVQKASKRISQVEQLSTQPSQSQPDFCFIKSGVKRIKVKIADILYVKAEGNYVSYITNDQKILSLDNFANVTKRLPEPQFVRVHKSYLVAIVHIDVLQKAFIRIGRERIPIGRAYRVTFFDRMGEFGGE